MKFSFDRFYFITNINTLIYIWRSEQSSKYHRDSRMTNTCTEPRWRKKPYERMCQVLPPSLTFWMLIAVIYWFAAFGRDRLTPLLMFAWWILTVSRKRTCHPRRLWNDKRKRRKRNIVSPVRTNVTISHLSWYRRMECTVSELEHFSKGLQICLQKNGRSPIPQ